MEPLTSGSSEPPSSVSRALMVLAIRLWPAALGWKSRLMEGKETDALQGFSVASSKAVYTSATVYPAVAPEEMAVFSACTALSRADKSSKFPVDKRLYGLYWLTTIISALELFPLMAEIILEKFVANVESAVFAAVESGKSGILLAAKLNIATCGISERVPASDAFTSAAVIGVSEFCLLLYSSARYAYSAFIRSLPPMVTVIRSAFFSVSAFASLFTTSSRSVEVAPSCARLVSVYPLLSATCFAKPVSFSASPYPVVMLSPRAT